MVVLGDSTAAGLGADHAHETIGAIIATGVAALMGRSVRLTNRAVVGAEAADLERQLANALEEVMRPEVCLIMIGFGPEDLLSRIFCAIATKDFDGDEMIWTSRKFLPNPKPLPDDGPIVAYRKWCERFWPPDYLPDLHAGQAVADPPEYSLPASAS